jgi:hypothetical protein
MAKFKKLELLNVQCLYRPGPLITVLRALAKCKSHLVSVQEVRWGNAATEPADSYTFLFGNGNADHHLGTCFFIDKEITSAVNMAE